MLFSYFYVFHIFIFLNSKVESLPLCKEDEKFCGKCNPLTNICVKCIYDNLIPDDNGGCIGKNQCIVGKNYCNECNFNGEICRECEEGYYPDKNGGCAYTDHCKLSYKGECLECTNDYILIGKKLELKICKYIYSDDFKNCKEINKEKGICDICEEGFFQNTGDKKCTQIDHCQESIYGNCISCFPGYYLNKKNNTCLLKENNFSYCSQTLDGENCELCDEYHYFDENGKCAYSGYCVESQNGKCKKCLPNYYLASTNSVCSTEEHCSYGDVDTGLCNTCDEDGYYLDYQDYKCKSNKEENDFMNCTRVFEGKCTQCIFGYKLTNDSKCTITYNCLKAENGTCISCQNKYYLGLDHKCTNVEHCIYSNEFEICLECEDNYYYNQLYKNCSKAEGDFENCKYSEKDSCTECKSNYYLNKNDSLCYDNTQEGPFYKCAKSDNNNEYCEECIDNYYLGIGDNKCSLIEDCKFSEDEFTCIECDDFFCLDLNKQMCVRNYYLLDENIKIYFACERTNEDGTACEKCINGYDVGKDGYCVDISKCLEEKDGECLKCSEEENINDYYYCANKAFGCVETISEGCLRCDDLLDLFRCTECKEGYKPGQYGGCEKNNKN